jgi:hypothetical protein
LDALDGTVCNVGSPDQGTLQVSYAKGGGVSFTCTPAQLYTVTVNITGGDGYDTVTSSPAGIDCDSSGILPGGAPAVCTGSFPADYSVTLTESSSPYDTDVLGKPSLTAQAWSQSPAGACPEGGGSVLAPPIQDQGFVPGSPLYNGLTCTITDITQNYTETLNFDAGLFVRNGSASNDGEISVSPAPVWPQGASSEAIPPTSAVRAGTFFVIPYGSTVTLAPRDSGATAGFGGRTCGPAATITATSCTFTLTQAANGQGPIGEQYWNALVSPSS